MLLSFICFVSLAYRDSLRLSVLKPLSQTQTTDCMNSYCFPFVMKTEDGGKTETVCQHFRKRRPVLVHSNILRQLCWLLRLLLYHTPYSTFTVLICCSRGKVEDLSASSCFSLSDIHKEKASNPAPNLSHWLVMSSKVLTLKHKSMNYKLAQE